MADSTLTYVSRPAGRQIAGSTYMAGADDAKAQAILTAATPFLIANSWKAINTADAIIDGDGSDITGTKQVHAEVLCADGTLTQFHIPFVLAAKGQTDVEAALFMGSGATGGQSFTNQAGSAFQKIVQYTEDSQH